jgi:uncharacterized lipoprotein YajG
MRTTTSAIAVTAAALFMLAACSKASNPSDTASTPSPPTADQGSVAANGTGQGTSATPASSNYDAAVSKAQADNRDALAAPARPGAAVARVDELRSTS